MCKGFRWRITCFSKTMDLPNHQLPARIPVIEFTGGKLKAIAAAGGGGDSVSWLKTSQEVVRALEEYGCFNAVYDGVSVELHESIFGVSEELFDLPVETKVLNTSTTPSHGYVGQVPLIPLYEGLGIENATTLPAVDQFTHLMWPCGNRRFRSVSHHPSSLLLFIFNKLSFTLKIYTVKQC